MGLPKSVVKIDKKGVTYTSNVDAANYTIRELTRAALRDCGQLICKRFREAFYQTFKRRTGKVGKNTQYFVKHKGSGPPELQVGFKAEGFYGIFQELGTRFLPKRGLLRKTFEENIDEMQKIQSKYLSAIDAGNAEDLISEQDYEGGEKG